MSNTAQKLNNTHTQRKKLKEAGSNSSTNPIKDAMQRSLFFGQMPAVIDEVSYVFLETPVMMIWLSLYSWQNRAFDVKNTQQA